MDIRIYVADSQTLSDWGRGENAVRIYTCTAVSDPQQDKQKWGENKGSIWGV